MSRYEYVEAPQSTGRYEYVDVPEPQLTFGQQVLKRQQATDPGRNIMRGIRDVIDTPAEWLAGAFDKIAGTNEAERVRAMNKQAKQEWLDTTGEEILPHVQRVLGNIAGVAPFTSAAGAAVGATGAGLGSPVLQSLGRAISSGGMVTGRAGGGAADLAIRAAGGGVNGYITAGMIEPEAANTGAVIGAATPLVIQGAGNALQAARRAYNARGNVGLSRDIAELAGVDPRNLDELARVRDALRQQGPSMIPGEALTVPQILQTPGTSQAQRTIRAAAPTAFAQREAEQEAARIAALNRVAPVGASLGETADDVGRSISGYAAPQREAAKRAVSAKFDAVDPFNESRVLLPIDEMRAAKDKFLGPGTFGSGGSAQQAINEAERIGTELLPAIKPAPVGRAPQNIVQAIRQQGGINPMRAGTLAGEVTELGRKQSGTTGLVSGKGKSVEHLAELMHERGFIPDDDPVTLLNAIRGQLTGETHYGSDVIESGFRSQLERSMGDAPLAERIGKPVSFQELQNLRSSIGEQWRAATRQGNAKEAAALITQQRAIDGALEHLASGNAKPGEYFASDMVANYKDARAAHAAKVQRFDTGPQSAMFRTGRDGEVLAQGAEIPRRFFNSSPSQIQDAQAFARLVQSDPVMMGELRRYAVTDAAGKVDRLGNLTSHKFNQWLDRFSGAIGVTFNEQQRATLRAIGDSLRRADLAESLGRGTGSDTAAKLAGMQRLGLADSPVSNLIAGHIPYGRSLLDFARGPLREAKAERLANLLIQPEQVGGLLDTFIATRAPQPQGLLGASASPLIYRSTPLLYSPGGGSGG